jgi:hypothetical protein
MIQERRVIAHPSSFGVRRANGAFPNQGRPFAAPLSHRAAEVISRAVSGRVGVDHHPGLVSGPSGQGSSSENWRFHHHVGPLLGVTTFENAWKEALTDCLPMVNTY